MAPSYCPQVGKLNIILVLSIIFTCLITAISVYSQDLELDQNLVNIGIFINFVSFGYTLYLIFYDIFDICRSNTQEDCNKKPNCQWFNLSPFSFDKVVTKIHWRYRIFICVFTLCCIFTSMGNSSNN